MQEHVDISQVPVVERIQEIGNVAGLVNPQFSVFGVEFFPPQAVGSLHL